MLTVPKSTEFRTRPYIIYCRFIGVAFLLVSGYTVWVKLPSGRLATDWLHTAIHVVTGAAALYLGWRQVDGQGALVLTWSVVLSYGMLGIVGWFVDGLAMGTSFRIPLMAADNVFHILLAGTGLMAILRGRW
jgi:hypothetical protein